MAGPTTDTPQITQVLLIINITPRAISGVPLELAHPWWSALEAAVKDRFESTPFCICSLSLILFNAEHVSMYTRRGLPISSPPVILGEPPDLSEQLIEDLRGHKGREELGGEHSPWAELLRWHTVTFYKSL